MLLNHIPSTANDVRQCLRIAGGATTGFLLSKLFGLNYGVFFTVFPMLLLGLVPRVSAHVIRQMLLSSLVSGLEVGLLGGLFGDQPGIMTPLVFVLFLYRFAAMSRGSLFLFGASGVLNLSIMLHFSSYPQVDLNTLIVTNIGATLLSVLLALLMTALWPDVTPRTPPKPAPKAPHRMRHEALLGAGVATLSYLVFQVLDLSDSLSALATTVLLLFPMHWNGALGYARKRAMGTVLGVTLGLLVQFILYNWSGLLLLIVPLLWVGFMLCSLAHVKEASGSGVGFGAMTTLGILFGQYLAPGKDFIFSAFYRVGSISVAIVATLLACYLLHKLLNSFEATRFG
ncbi:DUF2955 domain-containing protein [Shewanella sp. AS16]|uniref:DUF2955 domain-containing protein n=1 Tax=Shewanella sp. AS16 TaxID=2907625 RepID=UPI001F330638|nr:DUF2955 domain-containing protein [Shewanella sp. AS16]MCE9685747.1 DUF2955 domain-containing protein [Shewanella sp. AS16]